MNEAQTETLLRRTFRGSREALMQRAFGDPELTWRVLVTLNWFRLFVAVLLLGLFFGWSEPRIFGHKYRHLRIIRPGDRDSFEVLVTGEPDENGGRADLAIFPDPNRAWSEHVVAAMPEWVIGLVLAGLSLLFLCLGVFWHPRDPLSDVFRDPAKRLATRCSLLSA